MCYINFKPGRFAKKKLKKGKESNRENVEEKTRLPLT